MSEQAITSVKISTELIEKCRQKLKAHPNAPANYIVDQILRNFTED